MSLHQAQSLHHVAPRREGKTMKKKKQKHLRGLCLCQYSPTLSDEAAVQIHEFLQVIGSSLLARYGSRIERHYAKKSKPNLKELEPWRFSDEPF